MSGAPSTKVSVVVPTRNRSAMLREALASICALEGPDLEFEVLVADNGSTDDTVAVACELGAIVLPAATPGAAAARNVAMRAATGEFIAFLDDDDAWTAEHLRPHIALMRERPELGGVVGQTVMADGHFAPLNIPWPEAMPAHGRFFGAFFGMYPQIGATVVRAGVRETVGYMDEALLGDQDWDWHLRLALRHKLGFVAVPCTLFRQRPPGTDDDREWSRLGFWRKVFARNLRRAPRSERPSYGALARIALRHMGLYHRYFCRSAVAHAERGERGAAWRSICRAVLISPLHAGRGLLAGGREFRPALRSALAPGPRSVLPGAQVQEAGAEGADLVSVVIATRDRPADLERCLGTVFANVGVDYEVIVVDQGEGDGAEQCVTRFGDGRLIYFRDRRRGKSLALNLALEHARGSVIAFTDDDCTVPPDWLAQGVRALESCPGAGLAFGNFVAMEHDPREFFVPSVKFAEYEVLHGRPWRSRGLIGMGGNMFARRTLFGHVGGFDNDLGPGGRLLTGEECEMTYRSLRQGFAVVREPRCTVTHWGARPRGDGTARRLVNSGFLAVGAGYGKHVRGGDASAVAVVLHETMRIGALTARAAFRRKGPFHVRRMELFWIGVARGFMRGSRLPARRGNPAAP